MRSILLAFGHALDIAILRIAGWIVPRAERPEWLRSWRGELWRARRQYVAPDWFDLEGEVEAARFCLGAFPDAACLRQEVLQMRPAGSAARCVWALTAFALVCAGVSLMLPGARSVVEGSPYDNPQRLILVGTSNYSGLSRPEVRATEFRYWQTLDQHVFSGLAFYQIAAKKVHLTRHQAAMMQVARATPNLFMLLGVRVQMRDARPVRAPQLPSLLLAQRAWSRFGKEGPRAGQVIRVGTRDAIFAGVISSELWRLPGNADAWLLEPDGAAKAIPEESRGYVIGRLAIQKEDAEWTVSVARPEGGYDQFLCSSVADRLNLPLKVFLFAVFMALLALPATTPLTLGEYPMRRHKLPLRIRFRRWMFLCCKLGLALPVVGLASLDLAFSSQNLPPVWSQYIHLATSFWGALFAFRWVLEDQRKRCPVCLRKLGSPAEVGQKSRNFLDWYGTELVCSEGHGLLHVPEHPTSWFATQRWLCLDSSWQVLFAERHAAAGSGF